MKNSEYWKLRFEQLEQAQSRQGAAAFAEVEKQYKEAQKQIEGQIARWYQRFADNNGITLAQARQYLKGAALKEFQWDVQDYIKYGQDSALMGGWMKELENASAKYHISKLEALKIQTQQSLEGMFSKQMETVTGAMQDVFESGYYHTAYELQHGFGIGWDIAGLDQVQVEKVLSKPWAVDGKNFSERIWNNKRKLISEVHTELTQNILTGGDPQKAIDALAKKMNTSKTNAGRLVMTEEAYFSSAAQKDCFNELGVEQYEIVATLDSHTSDICISLDGQHFPMKDFEPGVTAPPFHVFCRSTTAPYFDESFGDIGERAARDAGGNTYYVPSDMTYKDWKKTFVDGGSKNGLYKGDAESIKALKEAIFNKNKSFLSETQQKEFISIVGDMTEGQLTLYDKLSEHFKNNEYHVRDGAYYPWQRKVRMDIDYNFWEKAAGVERNGAFQTKFHEEFHQLDHILGLNKTKFSATAAGNFTDEFTSIASTYGSIMIKAIDEDIVSVINRAVDWRNAERAAVGMDAVFKHIKKLDRISGDAKDSLVLWLKKFYGTRKRKAQIATFTDAVGLSTKNRIPLYSKGFWGHKPAYNKDRGKDGATSETWANFGAVFNCGDVETVKMISELMPSTWKIYSEIMEEVIEYAAMNSLSYPK